MVQFWKVAFSLLTLSWGTVGFADEPESDSVAVQQLAEKIDEFLRAFDTEIVAIFDVDDDGAADLLRKAAEAPHDPFAGGEPLVRKHHHGGIIGALDDLGLIHHHPVGRTGGGDDQGIGRGDRGEFAEDLLILARSDVVEVRVSSVEENIDVPLLDVADDFLVLTTMKFQVAIAGHRWNGDDGTGEVFWSDGTGLHPKEIEEFRC